MKRIASFFLALALAFSLTACTVPVEKADDGKIQIVATLFPYYDFARAIVGDRADVTLLLSPGREAHSFEPTPLDAVTISESDVFLYNGGEGEYWVDSMLGAAGENIAVIARMMDYVDALAEEYVEGMQGADGHLGMARIHRHADAGLHQGRHDLADAIPLLIGRDRRGARTRRFAAHVHNGSTGAHHFQTVGHSRLRIEISAAVGEGIGGHVQNAHDDGRAGVEVVLSAMPNHEC